MRDPKRIEKILDSLKKIWEDKPDLRFGQILIVLNLAADTYETWAKEDDAVEEQLEKFLRLNKP